MIALARGRGRTSTASPASDASAVSGGGAGEDAALRAGVAPRSGATEVWRDGGAGVAVFAAGAGVGDSGAGVAVGARAGGAAGAGERALRGTATSAGDMVVVEEDEEVGGER